MSAAEASSRPMKPTTSKMTIKSLRTQSDEIRHRDRLDASILRSFSERRVLRSIRTTEPSMYWDHLEGAVTNAATLLWEISSTDVHMDVSDDLLAFCAFLARELEVTEGMDLDADAECARLQALAPRALSVLDEITNGLVVTNALPSVSSSGTPTNFFTRALYEIIRILRDELLEAESLCMFAIAA